MKTFVKIKLIIFAVSLFSLIDSYSANPNRIYAIKYAIDKDNYAVASETTMTVSSDKISIVRNGEYKYWECEYKGQIYEEPVRGKKVTFHVFYLTNKHINIVISDYKLVKHNGVFYYSIDIDGQKQLAL